MNTESRFLVDVGMQDMPFPMRVASREAPDGQPTVATISVRARIMREFEARWIDTFIQVVHQHRERIGTPMLGKNIFDYYRALHAGAVTVDYAFPFFVEKQTPVSKAKCLVRYLCTLSAQASSDEVPPRTSLRIQVPVVTTYPVSSTELPGGLFGQLSVVALEVVSSKELYPENLVELVDSHAVAPMYSFLTEPDQLHLIRKIHQERKTSVVMVDELREALARNHDVSWYAIHCHNQGMLHSYSTTLATERSMWVPWSGYDDDEI
jgi:GTP cyclohydrolase IB